MSITDPISDMLTQLRNAYAVGKESLTFEGSRVKEAILQILKENGYISDFKKTGSKIDIDLKYKDDGKPAMSAAERISRPGRRIYVKNDQIPSVLSGYGISVISTSKGIVTGDIAKKEKLGGELICKVY
jgi:small subunit ribosomal protein S8